LPLIAPTFLPMALTVKSTRMVPYVIYGHIPYIVGTMYVDRLTLIYINLMIYQ